MDKKNYNYTRPEHTYQDLLSEQDIKDKLKDYKLIDNINLVVLDTHIRYYTFDAKTQIKIFRLGGFLQKIDPQNRFIMLTNNKISWSVQLLQSTLYQKMTEEEIKNKIKIELKTELKTEFLKENSTSEVKKLKEKIEILTSKLFNYNKLEESYNSLLIKYNDIHSKYDKLLLKK